LLNLKALSDAEKKQGEAKNAWIFILKARAAKTIH
jgi:hypothetical protein